MKEIKLASYAKINLSLDVVGVWGNGMHQVDMVMQQLSFHDDVTVKYEEDSSRGKGDIDIVLNPGKPFLPADDRNIAYKAAQLIIDKYGSRLLGGTVYIDIFKRIPVAAGMAGGSGNGAAVLHGLNVIWRLRLGLSELCSLGAELGSDVPFCVMGQAKCNPNLPKAVRKNKLAAACARAEGTGTDLVPLKGIRRAVVIAKPRLGVSTKEVYQGIDECVIREHPDTDRMVSAIQDGKIEAVYEECINVLEEYTLNAYPKVLALKKKMQKMGSPRVVLMSGSGPTVFAIYDRMDDAIKYSNLLRERGYESYWTKCIR